MNNENDDAESEDVHDREAMYIVPVLGKLAHVVQDRSVSWINGSKEVSTSMIKLFVCDHRHITFPFPSNEELKSLYDIAQPASFGHGQRVVLDSSYRSGRTLTADNFAINFRPDRLMLQQIKGNLLDTGCTSSEETERYYIRAELYRVNLYGPGDFFKEHKDTPQTGSGHFGSLVFCLPTYFEGGSFVIRDTQQQELRFDWGKEFGDGVTSSGSNSSSVSTEPTSADVPYVAFASDLDHWVEPVVSGYRVTLTFHLFRETVCDGQHEMRKLLLAQLPSAFSSSFGGLVELEAARALKHSEELRGKRVVFPLVHAYSARNGDDLVLKGGDAAMFQLLASLGVHPKLMFYYNRDEYDDWYLFEDEDDQGEKVYLTDSVIFVGEDAFDENACEGCAFDAFAEPIKVWWARRLRQQTLLSVGARFGNDVSLEKYYGNACIITSW